MTLPKPQGKDVAGVGIGAALAPIIVWLISLTGAIVPAEVSASLAAVLGWIAARLSAPQDKAA